MNLTSANTVVTGRVFVQTHCMHGSVARVWVLITPHPMYIPPAVWTSYSMHMKAVYTVTGA